MNDDFKDFCRKRPSAYSGKNDNVVFVKYDDSGIPLTMKEALMCRSVGKFHFMERERWEYLVDKHLRMWADDKSK